uniref:Uncharacterized protein n=1 Tax=viral metagenome TaxID=1070528 RepID=A0A6C0EGY6_9ZZZZ
MLVNKIFENPLTVSLILYVIITLIIYIRNPQLFNNDKSDDEYASSFLARNSCIIFIIIPVVIYGLVCGLTSYTNRKEYCKLLKSKELDIKELIQKCKK